MRKYNVNQAKQPKRGSGLSEVAEVRPVILQPKQGEAWECVELMLGVELGRFGNEPWRARPMSSLSDQDAAPRPTVPFGFCQCGCGRKAPLATVNRKRNGYVKGQPLAFILGHSHSRAPVGSVPPPNPSGLCLCGCGATTRIAQHSVPCKNIIAGEHIRYIAGHHSKAKRDITSRVIEVDGNPCRTVPLTRGLEAIVDVADWPEVSKHSWCAVRGYSNTTYAQSRIRNRQMTLHQFILPVGRGFRVDHENGNGLDCRRSNLRESTPGQNNHNRRQSTLPKYSRFQGVTFDCRPGLVRPWHAQIRVDGKNEYLGSFGSEEDAAHAYDARVKEHYGDRARLNFPS